MTMRKQIAIRATFMRGGTSKGVFFVPGDLPREARDQGSARDALLLRVVGSPDRYGQHIDGMGGATSSTSKVVLVSRSTRPGCDVDYLFGAVSVSDPVIDWSGNCGNLTAAVGPFAVARGLVDAPRDGVATVRIWQANIGKQIVAHVPMAGGEVQEVGDFELDGVTFPSAEIKLEFLDPGADDAEGGGAMFPTTHRVDLLRVPGVGSVEATLINAGNPTIFVDAASLGLRGTELQRDVNGDAALLERCESLRAHATVVMGLAATPEDATRNRPHTPKLAFVSRPEAYTASRSVGGLILPPTLLGDVCSWPNSALGCLLSRGEPAKARTRDRACADNRSTKCAVRRERVPTCPGCSGGARWTRRRRHM